MSFPQKNLCFLINAGVYTLNSFFWSTVHWSSSDGRLRFGTLKTTPGASSAGMGLTGEAGVIALDDGLEGNASGRGEEADISAVFVLGGWGSYSWKKKKKNRIFISMFFPSTLSFDCYECSTAQTEYSSCIIQVHFTCQMFCPRVKSYNGWAIETHKRSHEFYRIPCTSEFHPKSLIKGWN